jgi:hypothetical protein
MLLPIYAIIGISAIKIALFVKREVIRCYR